MTEDNEYDETINGYWYNNNRPKVWSQQHGQVYLALKHAAERMGRNAALDKNNWTKSKPRQFVPPQAQRDCIDMIYALTDGTVTPEAAMAFLHEYEPEHLRLGIK